MGYKVGIIGSGKIASGFDSLSSKNVLTHAHAVKLNPKMELIGFYDVDHNASSLAARKWGCKSFHSLRSLLMEAPDLIIIAVPDHAHDECLREVAEYSPCLVICEKPLTHDLESANQVVQIYSKKQIPLLVNFQRRYDPDIVNLQSQIKSGGLGRALGGSLIYSKGTKHNGSHAVDLFRFLFGELIGLEVFGAVVDFDTEDPTVSGLLKFPSININIQAADERFFSIFEIDLLFEKMRYRFTRSGMHIEISKPMPDPIFCGYCEMSIIESRDSGLMHSLENLMAASSQYLEDGILPTNTAEDALKTQKVCVQLIDLASKK